MNHIESICEKQSSWEGSNEYLGREFKIQCVCSKCNIKTTRKFKLANDCNPSYIDGKFVPKNHLSNHKYLYRCKDDMICKYCHKIKKLKE